jgi:hypothetical protein
MREQDPLDHLSQAQRDAADRALETWRDFLLDHRDNPGAFEQHLLPLDLVESAGRRKLSPYFNRYILRSIDIDVVASEDRAFAYAKMCRFVLIGFIIDPKPAHWRGTKLHVRRGQIGTRQYAIPETLMTYIDGKANEAARGLSALSQGQTRVIKEMFRTRRGHILNSEISRAMARDVALSGREAYTITRRRSEREPKS